MSAARPEMSWKSWFDPAVWFAAGERSESAPTVRLLSHATVDELVLAAFRRRAGDLTDDELLGRSREVGQLIGQALSDAGVRCG